MQGAKGRVTYCTGKDTTGETKAWSKRFNAKYRDQGLSVKLLEFPASADEQRQQFVQRQESRDGECDVVPLRRHLDRGVRLAGLAVRHDAVRRPDPRPAPRSCTTARPTRARRRWRSRAPGRSRWPGPTRPCPCGSRPRRRPRTPARAAATV